MSITLGLEAIGCHPHTALALQGHAEPQVAKDDFIFVTVFCQIGWGSQRSQGWHKNK